MSPEGQIGVQHEMIEQHFLPHHNIQSLSKNKSAHDTKEL